MLHTIRCQEYQHHCITYDDTLQVRVWSNSKRFVIFSILLRPVCGTYQHLPWMYKEKKNQVNPISFSILTNVLVTTQACVAKQCRSYSYVHDEYPEQVCCDSAMTPCCSKPVHEYASILATLVTAAGLDPRCWSTCSLLDNAEAVQCRAAGGARATGTQLRGSRFVDSEAWRGDRAFKRVRDWVSEYRV